MDAYVPTRTRAHTRARTHTHMHTRTHARARAHTHTHTHTHARTHAEPAPRAGKVLQHAAGFGKDQEVRKGMLEDVCPPAF